MTLPENKYVNSLWETAKGPQTLLAYTAIDNELAFFPGYAVSSKITRTYSDNKFIYRRLQTHAVLLDRPVQIAINMNADEISCLISLDVASVSYIQETQQSSDLDLSSQIVATGKFKNKSTYELWDEKDFWYVSEQALHTQFVIPNAGSPTNREYSQSLAQAELNLERGLDVLLDKVPDVDYRLYRPLPLLPMPLPDKLKQTFKIGQATIEGRLKERLKSIDAGQQDWQITPIVSYNSASFPVVASSAKVLSNFLNLVLQDVTNFISV
jgi:hypothetical protein